MGSGGAGAAEDVRWLDLTAAMASMERRAEAAEYKAQSGFGREIRFTEPESGDWK